MDYTKIKTAKYYKDTRMDLDVSVTVNMTDDANVTYSIPINEENSDYQEILKWVAAGNTIEASDND